MYKEREFGDRRIISDGLMWLLERHRDEIQRQENERRRKLKEEAQDE